MKNVGGASCLLALACVQVLIGLHAEPERAVARLVAVDKLWATIKYFHPDIGEDRPEEWDAALVEVIPLAPHSQPRSTRRL